LVEDVRWIESRVAFATMHVIGSNNGLASWAGIGQTTPTPLHPAEVDARINAVLAWGDATFDAAEANDVKGVVSPCRPTPGRRRRPARGKPS
jgi:hypothetical protein